MRVDDCKIRRRECVWGRVSSVALNTRRVKHRFHLTGHQERPASLRDAWDGGEKVEKDLVGGASNSVGGFVQPTLLGGVADQIASFVTQMTAIPWECV